MNINVGYLFKKRIIKEKKQEYEVYEFLDYVVGICYQNKKGNIICNIVSGNYTGEYAKDLFEDNDLTDCCFLRDNFDKVISNNNNKVDFNYIRSTKLDETFKYYIRSTKDTIRPIEDKKLEEYIDNIYRNKQSGFNEKELKEGTDISSMYKNIKRTIVSQDEQIMKILTALFKNQKVINSKLSEDLIAKLKENILICGSTGTGKTEILKRISKIYDIPIVIEDATALSETGYQGRNITDMLEDLYKAANENLDLAQKGILVIDEIDKLAEKNDKDHVSRSGVQRSLLKLLDGTEFYLNNIKFDTSKLTIVGLGAFTGITKGDDYGKLTSEDFMKYGIMRELVGRFSKIIPMNPLTKKDIIKILTDSNFSPLNTYKEMFNMLNIEFEYTDEFIEYIADLSIKKQSGARSLKTVFDDCISSALFRIFAGEYSKIIMIKPKSEFDNPYILEKIKNSKQKKKKIY